MMLIYELMWKNKGILIFILFFISLLLYAEEERVALVIGNADYVSSALRNPVNDAIDIAQTLKSLGFQVKTALNVTQREMDTAIHDFGEQLYNNEVSLFYYAGHGAQYDGENYLIPIGGAIHSSADLKYKAIPVGVVLEYMNQAQNKLNIIILDACRDNPFSGTRGVSRGLAVIEALPKSSLLIYATQPGNVAEDGNGRNSPFTQAFLDHVTQPGVDIKKIFDYVARDVTAQTQNRQRPWLSTDFYEEFFFSNGSGKPTPKIDRVVDNIEIRTDQVNMEIYNSIAMLDERREVLIKRIGEMEEEINEVVILRSSDILSIKKTGVYKQVIKSIGDVEVEVVVLCTIGASFTLSSLRNPAKIKVGIQLTQGSSSERILLERDQYLQERRLPFNLQYEARESSDRDSIEIEIFNDSSGIISIQHEQAELIREIKAIEAELKQLRSNLP